MVCCEQVDMAQHLWVNAAHNRGPRCAVLQELKPLGGDTYELVYRSNVQI